MCDSGFEGALGSEKEDRDHDLEDGDDETGADRFGRSGDPVHNVRLRKGRRKRKGRGNARLFQRSFAYIICTAVTVRFFDAAVLALFASRLMERLLKVEAIH